MGVDNNKLLALNLALKDISQIIGYDHYDILECTFDENYDPQKAKAEGKERDFVINSKGIFSYRLTTGGHSKIQRFCLDNHSLHLDDYIAKVAQGRIKYIEPKEKLVIRKFFGIKTGVQFKKNPKHYKVLNKVAAYLNSEEFKTIQELFYRVD